MIYINHELKAIYVRTPRSGGKYISRILTHFYDFKEIEYIRDDISEFFDNDDDLTASVEHFSTKIFSIKKKGIIRYILDETEDFSHLPITKEQWDSYYKFSFVVDPYYKLISSYLFCKASVFPDDNTPEHYSSLKSFLENKDAISNVAFFSCFLPQFDHLLDHRNDIKMQYIGNIETLDNDLTIVLNHLGINTMRHIEFENLNDSFHYRFERRLKDVPSYFDEETLAKTNEYFKHDFECFHLPPTESTPQPNITKTDLFFKTHIEMIQENKSHNLLKKMESDFALFVNYLEKTYKITANNFVFTQFKEEFSKNFENIQKDNRTEWLQNTLEWMKYTNEEFDKEKQHRECSHCHFVCYNERAKNAHTYFCVPI